MRKKETRWQLSVGFWSVALLIVSVMFAQTAPPTLDNGAKLAALGRVGWDRIEKRGNYISLQLEMLLFQSQPSLLDEKANMFDFVMVNNCFSGDLRKIQNALNSEFDSGAVAAYYKTNAPEILKIVPSTFTLAMLQVQNPENKQLLTNIVLGDYDVARKSFPFENARGRRLSFTLDNVTPARGNGGCPIALTQYMVNFDPVSFSELKVDEAAARQYVADLVVGRQRSVTLLLEVKVLPKKPEIDKDPSNSGATLVTFAGKLNKITVASNETGRPIGTLYP